MVVWVEHKAMTFISIFYSQFLIQRHTLACLWLMVGSKIWPPTTVRCQGTQLNIQGTEFCGGGVNLSTIRSKRLPPSSESKWQTHRIWTSPGQSQKEWVTDNIIYIYIYTHTHTHTYIYMREMFHNFIHLILFHQGSCYAIVPESIWTGPCLQLWEPVFLYHSSSAWYSYQRHQDGTSLKVSIKPVSADGYDALEAWNWSNID